jgi:predicted CopG family antitoxin
MKSTTTISIGKDTLEKIKRIGKEGETYDDIINRLLEIGEGEVDELIEVYQRMKISRDEYIPLDEL